MNPKATPTLRISFEPPCADQVDGLLGMVVGRDNKSVGDHAALWSHVEHCARCEEFVSGLRSESRAINRSFSEWTFRRLGNERNTVADRVCTLIESRLDQLGSRSVARYCWQLAREVEDLDAAFRQCHMIDAPHAGRISDDQLSSPAAVGFGSVRYDMARALGNVRGRSAAEERALREAAKALIESVKHSSASARMQFARRILQIGLDAANGHFSDAYIDLANIEWSYGDEFQVPGLLEKAISSSLTSWGRAEAIGNLAAWLLENESVDAGLRLNRMALDLVPSKPTVLWNDFVWSSMLGNWTKATSSWQRICATTAGREVVRRHGLLRLRSVTRFLGELFHLSLKKRETRSDELISIVKILHSEVIEQRAR